MDRRSFLRNLIAAPLAAEVVREVAVSHGERAEVVAAVADVEPVTQLATRPTLAGGAGGAITITSGHYREMRAGVDIEPGMFVAVNRDGYLVPAETDSVVVGYATEVNGNTAKVQVYGWTK